MSSVVLTVIANNFVKPAYENMFGFVCPKAVLDTTADTFGLDYAEGKEHGARSRRLLC